MRIIMLTCAAIALGACSASTDEEDASLTIDVDEDAVQQAGEDAGAIASDIGRDIKDTAVETTDRAQAEISREADEAEAEMEAEDDTPGVEGHSGNE